MPPSPEAPLVAVTRPLPEPGTGPLEEAGLRVVLNEDDRPLDADGLRALAEGADALLCMLSDRVDAALLDAVPTLRVVANYAVGFDNIDVAAARERGVEVTTTPGVLTDATADLAWALVLAAARRVPEGDRLVRTGSWAGWAPRQLLGQPIAGRRLGIVGMGAIGQAVAARAGGFGMEVVYHNRSRLTPDLEAACKARYLGKEELLRTADHVVLVLPYSPQSHHTIGAAELALMKPTATLVNIARGGIVDDAALAAALRDRRIAAAGLDVFEGEPQVHPDLLALSNVVLTPHIASATVATRRAMAMLAADNLIAFLGGRGPLTPVNRPMATI